MGGGKHMAKQLDCTTSIASTQNNGIHGIHLSLHTTFSRLSRLSSKPKPGYIYTSGVDWTTSKSKHSNQQMPFESSSLNSNSGSAMIVGMKIIPMSLEYYTIEIFSNVSSSFWHISNFRHTSMVSRCALLTLMVIESPAR